MGRVLAVLLLVVACIGCGEERSDGGATTIERPTVPTQPLDTSIEPPRDTLPDSAGDLADLLVDCGADGIGSEPVVDLRTSSVPGSGVEGYVYVVDRPALADFNCSDFDFQTGLVVGAGLVLAVSTTPSLADYVIYVDPAG